MKKLSFLLVIMFILIAVLSLTSCTKHKHRWVIEEKVDATCFSSGLTEGKHCAECDEILIYQSYIDKISCDWQKISTTATCEQDGMASYKCSMCNQIKTEQELATGHNFRYHGYCNNCTVFKYDITFADSSNQAIEFPVTLTYKYTASGHVYSRCSITKIDMEIQNSKLVLFFYGSKTYDEDGAFGTTGVKFQYVIKDDLGNILDSDFVSISNLIVGQSFGVEGYYGEQTISTSLLDEDATYYILLIDRSI